MNEQEAAGVLLMKDEEHQYFFSIRKDGNARKVSVEKITKQGVEVVKSIPLKQIKDPVKLKVVSDGLTFNFYCAVKKDVWQPVTEGVDAHFLSTANSFGFTGTTIGMFATKR
jgi:alpha-N-arabinofuranosidase